MNIEMSGKSKFFGNECHYKIIVSIGFGLIGFIINFFPINFYFPHNVASFLWGLVFTMIITLAWGWKYGLLSATIGLGCQTMWFLWLPTGGWAPFVSVPLFTLWIVWHGWVTDRQRKKKGHWQNHFIMEIPFRIFNTIILYTFFIWIFQFNPTPWAPSAKSSVSIDYVNFVVIKEMVNGYIVLLISHVLINLGKIRKILKLEPMIDQTNTNYIISGFILIGLLFWVLDGFLSFFIFEPGQGTLLDLIILNVPLHTMFIRFMFLLTCMCGGLLISIYLRKQRESEIKYEDAYNRALFYKDLFAHDINNILQNLQSANDIIHLYLNDYEENDILKESINIMRDQIKRGAKLVSNVRRISEIEESEIIIKPIEISELIRKSINYVKNSFPGREINIQVDSNDKKYLVNAGELLIDVFENVLIIAIRYNNNSIIEIIIRFSKIQKDGISNLKLEFIDNGKGIHDKMKNTIFQRADKKTRTFGGMGLGLSLVKNILAKYDGEIWVEDKIKGDYSKGADFIILIPEVVQ